jgi:hypothetical protein
MSLRYAVIDGCPVPRAYYPVFRKLKRESGCTFNSIYRGQDAAKILHRHGHHTQAEIIRLYAEGIPGYGPANPVRESTHCLYNDGVAYPHLPAGRRLSKWQVGFDVNDDQINDVKRAASRLGWHVRQPYHSGAEFHHLNLTRKPARWKLLYHAVFGRWPGRKHR